MKRILASLLVAVTLLPIASLSPALAYAADDSTPVGAICGGVGLTTADGTCGDNGAQFSKVLTAIINLLIVIVGIVSVIMLVIAGFNFITSGGDSGKVATARSSVIYALIGLVIVALSELIVHFALGTVIG